ncbi:MAG TPA: DUF4376 domain-containing protein [Candidatus Paceibacterota bacterium]
MNKLVINLQTGVMTVEAYSADELALIAASQPTVSQYRDVKIAEIERKRDDITHTDVSALGTMWQADDRSQKLLVAAILLTQAGLPLPPVWRDSFNNDMPVTDISQLIAIANAMATQTQAAYLTSWQLKAQVNAATTVAEVDAVQWI